MAMISLTTGPGKTGKICWQLEEERTGGPEQTYSLTLEDAHSDLHVAGLSITDVQLLQLAICGLKQRLRDAFLARANAADEAQRIGLVRIADATECDGGLAVG